MSKPRFNEFKEFVDGLSGKLFIVYHFDVDGFCSAALFYHALKEKCKFVFVPCPPALPSFASELKKDIELESPDALVFVDIQVNPRADEFGGMDIKTLVMDHHEPPADFSSESVIHVNTHFFSKKYYPASKLVYDYFEKAGYNNVKKYKWLAGVGTVSDKGGEEWKEFIDEIYNEHPSLKREKGLYGFESELGEIGKRLTSAITYYGRTRADTVMDIIAGTESPDELLESKELKVLNDRIQAKVMKAVKHFKEKSESHGTVVFCKSADKQLKSITATILSMEEPDNVFVIYSINKSYVFFSMRHSSSRINLSKMLKRISNEIPGMKAGGHAGATGGVLKKKFFEKFKNSVISYVNKREIKKDEKPEEKK